MAAHTSNPIYMGGIGRRPPGGWAKNEAFSKITKV
jgi:hypothetical protein